MANNRNEIIDSGTNYAKRTDCFVRDDISNATNEGLPTSEGHTFFHKILKYLVRSTARIVQRKRKKCDIRKRSVSSKSEEKIAVHTSLSSIGDNVIKSDAEAVVNYKKKMIDAITSTTGLGKVFDKVTHKNLSDTVEHFVYGVSYQYAEYAAKYVDNAVPERDCGPLCIGIGTQSDTVAEKYSLETSPDAFAKACEERRHADFILKEIAKVSDALAKKARLDSTKEASILASVSATSPRYELGEETFESTRPLIPSIIRAEEEATAVAVAAAAPTVMQPEMFTEVLVPSSSHLAPDSRECSVCLDKSLDGSDIQVIPSIRHLRRHLRKTEHTRTVSVMYPERDDLRDTAVTVARKKKREKSPKKIPLRPKLDKYVGADKASYSPLITNYTQKLKKDRFKSLDLYQPNDIQADASRRKITTVKKDVDSSIEISQMGKRPAQIAKDILQKSVLKKRVKYRAKYRVGASYMTKEDEMLLTKISKKPDKIPKYGCLLSPPPEAKRTYKFFNCFERSKTEIYSDCRGVPSRCLRITRYCEDLIPKNIYLKKYCDVWTTPCSSSRNEATRNATLSHAHCRVSQDSCALEYRASYPLLIDSHASSRYCNVNADCTKRRVTLENSLCANTYCKSDAKYCYPQLNNIDNIRMGYYHCNDSCPVWNNNQHCGRDRSYYWTKGNLYFTHPWTSEHLLRYN